MTTLILGAHGPLGLACARQLLQRDRPIIAAVQAPHRVPPAVHDLRDEFPALLTVCAWQPTAWPALSNVSQIIVSELPIPPAQSDESTDAVHDVLALTTDELISELRSVVTPTLAALKLVARLRPTRALVLASWLGVIDEKIRGGGYVHATAYASQLMLVRSAAIDLQRSGIAMAVANAGRYKLDMAGPGFHADVDDVARGLLTLLDAASIDDELSFRDWRGTVRRW